MGDPVVTNIVHSGAKLYQAPVGEPNPDETTVNFDDPWGGNWARVGYTKAPLTFAYESEEADINVEEELAPVKRKRIRENLTIETTLAELTGEYVQLAASNQDAVTTTAPGAAQKGFEETGLGGKELLTEMKWGFEARAVLADGSEQPVRIFVHIATARLNGNLQFTQKTEDTPGIPIQIKALADTSQAAGQKLCIFQRVTAAATS